MKQVCIIPNVSGIGGMVSFRGRFTTGLERLGVNIRPSLKSGHPESDAILVIGGTRSIAALWQAKRRGARIVQRLNGMNWLHRKMNTGAKHYMRAEYGNLILRIIRSRISDHIVYQSNFAEEWWGRCYGKTRATSSVVYNAVDLDIYSPDGDGEDFGYTKPKDRYRVLMVEGSLGGGYEMGINTAIKLVETLNVAHRYIIEKPVELIVAGNVSEHIKDEWSGKTEIPLKWIGLIPGQHIPPLDRSAHFLFSSDINAACPNSVIEALACGTPVLGFNTGALPELIQNDSGVVVPYGGDPWKIDKPDVQSLAEGGVVILMNIPKYQRGARSRAINSFGLDKMMDGYLQALYPEHV
jgi:glycosyltransferase involved in cell wall biosynthesis